MKKNSKKMIQWSLLSFLLVVTTGAIIGYKMYTKPHRNVEEAKAIKVSAVELANLYENNEPEANAKYLDKVLEVKGEVSEITKNQKGEVVITLKGTDLSGLICTLEGAIKEEIKPNTSVALKGICTGFLTDVVLIRCIFQDNEIFNTY